MPAVGRSVCIKYNLCFVDTHVALRCEIEQIGDLNFGLESTQRLDIGVVVMFV